jgi:predicted transposase YdaD
MLKGDLKDNWFYQEMVGEAVEEAREEAHTEGRLEGIQVGQMKEIRQNIEDLVEEQCPGLLTWVKTQVEQITDLAILRTILRVVARAATEDEIKAAFPAQS